MKTNVWILNHYSGDMYLNKGGRHYWFAKFLNQKNYKPVIFCANTNHDNKGKKIFETHKLWEEHISEEINTPFVFVKAREYIGNGKKRILNMLDFYINVKKAAKQYSRLHGKPDVIVASSVHPLTLVAGIKLAKYFGVKCICEVRDLWPESIVAYGVAKKNNPLISMLYKLEKWIYKKADKIVMTIQGGPKYIKDKGWEKDISASKITNINNGVCIDEYNKLKEQHQFEDADLDSNSFKVVYTGSIRLVNKVDDLLEAARIIKSRGNLYNIKILVWGGGDKKEEIEAKAKEYDLDNFKLKGVVHKEQIPSLLSKADCCVLHNSSTAVDKYGQSQNKLFEYLASGKPVLMTYSPGFSIIESNGCGLELKKQTPEEIANALESLASAEKSEIEQMGRNCEMISKEYDFEKLTQKYISLIES